MRAWWSQLFVPQNETNLRKRYACSLLCLELPTQKIESGPDSFFRSSIFLLISSSAWSQLIFWYLPLTSLTGVLRRIECSCIPCSRTEAPFAQCAPRLSGESNTGSCRVHTPFSTVASIAHPTEQCRHTVRLTSTLVAASAAASTLPMPPYGSWLANAPAPATRPERFKNVRRSIPATGTPVRRRRRGPAAATLPFFRVSSMILPLLELCPTVLHCGSNRGHASSRDNAHRNRNRCS